MCTSINGYCPICLLKGQANEQQWSMPTPMVNVVQQYKPMVMSGVDCGHTVGVNAWKVRNNKALVYSPGKNIRV